MMNLIKFFAAIIFVFSGLAFQASAQTCGTFGVTLNVHDNDLKPVTDYTVRLVPWLKDELNGAAFLKVAGTPGRSALTLQEDHVVTGNYKAFITAPGFLETEVALTFPHCIKLSHDVLLLRKKEKRRLLAGRLGDMQARSIPYAVITFTGSDGTTRTINSDFLGNYEIKLKPGNYSMTVTKGSYYEPYTNPKLKIPEDGALDFNVRMKMKQ